MSKKKLTDKQGAAHARQKNLKAKAEAADAEALAGATPADFRLALRVGTGFALSGIDPRSTPAFSAGKKAGELAQAGLVDRIAELQERLYAESKFGGSRSVLLVVQGMDTAGKGGIMRHVVGAMDPQAIEHTAFKAPSQEERSHHFLWRIRNALPQAGHIGVFDRSHYEDVLIVRVHNLVAPDVWGARYDEINEFEREVAASGTTIVKVMLHISKDEQKARLTERLARPDKHWKFNPGDIAERGYWGDYQEAYQAALTRCSTDDAAWYCVPADRKWYARLAVTNLVLDALTTMNPTWPAVDFDVAEQQARLATS